MTAVSAGRARGREGFFEGIPLAVFVALAGASAQLMTITYDDRPTTHTGGRS